MNQVTVGRYLAQRLEEVGIRDYFAIPGDFNLSFLDEPGDTFESLCAIPCAVNCRHKGEAS